MTSSRFQLRQKIANTQYSEVWRAYDEHLQLEVALKRPAESPTAANALDRELEVLRQVQHAGIVTLLDEGHDEAGRFVCLRWIDGESLETRLSQQPLSEEPTLRLLRELLSALVQVHDAGFVHGDLSADNIIMGTEGHVTLLDFGNTSKLGAPAAGCVGSIYAMAPELFDHQPPSVATDLYAVGVLAYQCLCGQMPFQGDKAQVITAHLRHIRRPLGDLCPVSPALEAWIERMTAVSALARPASVSEALNLLPRPRPLK